MTEIQEEIQKILSGLSEARQREALTFVQFLAQREREQKERKDFGDTLPTVSAAEEPLSEEELKQLKNSTGEYVSDEEVKYAVTELADIFGVSVQTIYDWVKVGRFVGLEKSEPNQHLEIPESTLWKARNGRLHPISEFVKEWEGEREKKRGVPLADENEYEFLVGQVVNFENKYGGKFDATLGRKEVQSMTAQEESDASMWQYLLARLEIRR
ncbi:helix-turn-helix transcriptional regulator [Bacillus mycoides]|uniref:helix-turn-helix transcriptional regulator n=1 Tax=Bacillus mycoides TaxID=1405 RepID=UPI003D1F49F8